MDSCVDGSDGATDVLILRAMVMVVPWSIPCEQRMGGVAVDISGIFFVEADGKLSDRREALHHDSLTYMSCGRSDVVWVRIFL